MKVQSHKLRIKKITRKSKVSCKEEKNNKRKEEIEWKKNNQKYLREISGITLIALVITIIVLLILAGVALRTVTGYESIPNQASKAVDEYKDGEAVAKEQAILDEVEALLEAYLQANPPAGGLTPLTGKAEVDSNGLATKKTLIKPDANDNLQIVIPEGFAPAILNTNSTISGPGQDGRVASIMPADQWKNITKDQINKGIVIVDHAITYDNGQATGTVPDFNEFVWVPIPDDDDFDRTAWMQKYEKYQGSTRYYETEEQPIAEKSTVDAFWEDATNTEYTNMVSSVEQHKGFYIGRYEASVNSSTAQSKRGQEAKVRITQTDSITACASNTAIPNIHLMYGIEWDSTLNWLNGKATIGSSTVGATKIMALDDIQTNSITWGNYANSTGDAATNKGPIQNTGTSEYWKANNIYDLAGNVYEWTQEKYGTGSTCAVRGGIFYGGGDYTAVADRISTDASINFSNVRF